ncbi:M28 family metallopeptidase [Pseudodesulfovibrio sp.]|uniref:M28 family metallopeptidase n=1 Tax=unclassified Pseudodesulfovibrio TaxID=2661612 RepID=UPI003B00F37D
MLKAGEITKHLSEAIGPRYAGSEGEKKAAEYIADQMETLGLEVSTQEFKFIGWEVDRHPSLTMLTPEKKTMDVGLFMYSDSTPEGGVTGKLEYVGTMYIATGFFEWPKYAVVDDDGNHLAYIVAHVDGPANNFVLYDLGHNYGCAPYVVIAKEDHEYFNEQLAKGAEITVTVDIAGHIAPGKVSRNVIGTLKGSALPDEEIVVCGHYDSSPDSPGACDNASGVDAMLLVAQKMIDAGVKKTIRFIAFGAEENVSYGSNYFVSTLKERGELARVKNVINLDMVGQGETLMTTVSPASFQQQVQAAFAETIEGEFDIAWGDRQFQVSDHYPFHMEGIPSVMLLFWPYDYYHQSTDTYDKVDPDRIAKTAKAAESIARALTL